MGCCLAIALIFSIVRRIWTALAPSARSTSIDFAPPARYPAPALVAFARRPRRTSALTAGLATGLVAYLVSTDGLALADLAEVPPLASTASLVRLLGTAILLAIAWQTTSDALRSSDRDSAALAIAAGAAAWSLASVLEMHVLGLVTMTSSSFALDVVIHGAGLLTAALLFLIVRFRSPLTTEEAT